MKQAQEALLRGKASTLAYSVGLSEADVQRVGGATSDRQGPGIVLSGSTAKAFNQALDEPAQVNERLAQALKRPRTFAWLDRAAPPGTARYTPSLAQSS